MIRIIKRITSSAVWDINGTEVTMKYSSKVGKESAQKKIIFYLDCLKNRSYLTDNAELCKAFEFFGGIAFVAVGMTSRADFVSCYTYYSKEFTKEWAKSDKHLKSKFVGYEYVFAKMLENENHVIHYNFKYILDGQQGGIFSQINEESFSEFWTQEMLPLMQDLKSFQDIVKRVGFVRVSKYLMQTPTEAEHYLTRLANQYSNRRELISLRKINNYIFGDHSRTSFAGGDKDFFTLLNKVVADELEIQKVKFIVENHKQLDVNKDIWVLYQMQGITLKFMRVDFTKVERLSLRQELKYFLKNRFSYAIRINDRAMFCLFDIANRLCENNPSIHYFADVELVDIKALQIKLEQETSQTAIMTLFSALKVLFDYLCSDENISPYPKPMGNVLSSIKFFNAKKYHEGTKYIPDNVMNRILEHVNELGEVDSLVFQTFAQTGMRAKEVSFLEADCLKKARYEDYYILSYIPYKTVNARRKKGATDKHEIYISGELSGLIAKQIKRSKEIRKSYNLPYIFLHQNKWYKPAMLNVEYFATKINNLIAKYNLCDTDGHLWNFTSHQCRKTVVVDMIENGATVNELAQKLGHLSQSTVMQYYAEVRNMKLAELNTEFYKKQFDVLISQERLTHFSEEERRLLYVGFRLDNRRVELGFCSRKLCDGACNNMSITVHCVNCYNLCTGKQYLDYWKQLRNSQQEIVDALVLGYEQQNLMDYESYAEYISENRLLLSYQNIVLEIKESEV